MLVEQMEKKQVATFSGALDEWARAVYPSPELIASMKQSGEFASAETEMSGLLASVAAGSSLRNALAASGLEKRACICPVFVGACLLTPGCDGLCIILICSG